MAGMLSMYMILVLNDKRDLLMFSPNILTTHVHCLGHLLPLKRKENCMM